MLVKFFDAIRILVVHSVVRIPGLSYSQKINTTGRPADLGSAGQPNVVIVLTDEQMRLFIENLEKSGVYDNTIFIFMTDNGTAAGVKFDKEGNVEKGFNADMRGTKGSQYEGGHRVPFFLHWPAKKLAARAEGALAGMVDVLPTLLDLCGIQQNKAPFDGISLAPTPLKNQPVDPERILITDTQRESYPVEGKLSAVIQGG